MLSDLSSLIVMKALERIEYLWWSRIFPAAKVHSYLGDPPVMSGKQILLASSFIAFQYQNLSTRKVLLMPQSLFYILLQKCNRSPMHLCEMFQMCLGCIDRYFYLLSQIVEQGTWKAI